jgi:hypothetical protein
MTKMGSPIKDNWPNVRHAHVGIGRKTHLTRGKGWPFFQYPHFFKNISRLTFVFSPNSNGGEGMVFDV